MHSVSCAVAGCADAVCTFRIHTTICGIEWKVGNIVRYKITTNVDFSGAVTDNLSSVVDVAPDLAITVDPSMFRVVLETLFSNAVKYTPNNGNIQISAEKIAEEMIEVSIADTGIGIPEDEQDQLFKKMYRASNAQDIDGAGLGLYMLKIILTALGGSISFESSVGKGTTFRIHLPEEGDAHEGTSHLEFGNK